MGNIPKGSDRLASSRVTGPAEMNSDIDEEMACSWAPDDYNCTSIDVSSGGTDGFWRDPSSTGAMSSSCDMLGKVGGRISFPTAKQ